MSDEKETSPKVPARDAHGRLLPGGTSNPRGRPKGAISLVHYLREELEREVKDKDSEGNEEKVARGLRLMRKILTKAEQGDPHTLKLVMNYIEGLPKQSVDLTSGGKPIPILGGVSQDAIHPDNSSQEDTGS